MHSRSKLLPAAFAVFVSYSTLVHADVLCVKKRVPVRNGKVATGEATKVFPGTECPRRFQSVLNTETFRGPAGQDASAAIYGTGSAGELVIGPGSTTLDQANLNFTNITIQPGGSLILRSGSILRCTGNFINQGNIDVIDFAKGGRQNVPTASRPIPQARAAEKSEISSASAGNGECGDNSLSREGGTGGEVGYASLQPVLSTLTRFRAYGGGGGGTSHTSAGGDGGGVIYIVCAGSINNIGTIDAVGAQGNSGSGGGGGGVIIIGSGTQIENPGVISVAGGTGGSSTLSRGAGGGGAGGFALLIAPAVNSAPILVGGGLPGSNAVDITSAYRCGGGGGGPSLSFGGAGGAVDVGGNADDAGSGNPGDADSIIADPGSILFGL